MIIGVVFARGGSKGVYRKNLRIVAGESLTARAVRALQAVDGIDLIAISTDDPEIASVASIAGADLVIMRPEELASDHAPELLSWRHAIEFVEERSASPVRILVSAPPTSPLRLPSDIERCLKALEGEPSAEIAITMSPAARNPWFNLLRKRADGFMATAVESQESIGRRQDAPECFDMATVAYAARREYVMNCTGLLKGRVVGIEVPFPRNIDIDTENDLRLCEFFSNEGNVENF